MPLPDELYLNKDLQKDYLREISLAQAGARTLQNKQYDITEILHGIEAIDFILQNTQTEKIKPLLKQTNQNDIITQMQQTKNVLQELQKRNTPTQKQIEQAINTLYNIAYAYISVT